MPPKGELSGSHTVWLHPKFCITIIHMLWVGRLVQAGDLLQLQSPTLGRECTEYLLNWKILSSGCHHASPQPSPHKSSRRSLAIQFNRLDRKLGLLDVAFFSIYYVTKVVAYDICFMCFEISLSLSTLYTHDK